MTFFSYRNGVLHAEDVSLELLAHEVATPLYVYSASGVEYNYKRFEKAFSGLKSRICYAMKANSNQAVVTTLARLGAGMDIVSQGELVRAIRAGVPGERICFSGVGKTQEEMAAALTYGISCFNVESEEELGALAHVAQSCGRVAPVAFRVNPNISARTHSKITTGTAASKFGIPFERIVPLYKRAQELSSIDPVGVDMHLGSQMTDLTPLDHALGRLASLVDVLRSEGIALRYVDVGGGLGIPYHDDDVVPTLSEYAALVKRHMAPLGLTLIVEPGRFLVGDTGLLLTRVLYRKTTEEKTFLIVDGGMNDLIRPTLYDMPHALLPVLRPEIEVPYEMVDVVGPVCESGDYLGLGCSLPISCKAGDLLAVMTAGAYGAVLSGTYNSRRLIPEIMVRKTEYDVVRQRPSHEDLMAQDSLPYWLSKKAVE